MHIELTDYLRCPRPHEESYLVLFPGRVEGRLVIAGSLGCPECGWQHQFSDGVPDYGGGWLADDGFPVPAEAVPAMLGLEGAGGWLALAGRAGAIAPALSPLMPRVHLIAVNPPADILETDWIQVIRSGVWPVKSHSLRGIVAGSDAAVWASGMLASLLPGRQMIGEGQQPDAAEILASGGNIWVGKATGQSGV